MAYATLIEACGLVDRSERGKLALTGSEAKSFLQGQVTNDVEGLEPGRGCYAAFLTHKGKMLGDLRVLAVAVEDEAVIDPTNRLRAAARSLAQRHARGKPARMAVPYPAVGPARRVRAAARRPHRRRVRRPRRVRSPRPCRRSTLRGS